MLRIAGPLRMEDYFIPGSILRTHLDTSNPITYGTADQVDMMFNRSPVFRLESGAEELGVRRIGWYPDSPLRSGWAWGQEHVGGGLSAIEADVGDGKLYIFGPEVLFRAQPYGTFKLVFNGIFLAGSKSTNVN